MSCTPPSAGDRRRAIDALALAAYSLSAADARLRGRATRQPGALSLPHARALRVLAEQGPLTVKELAELVQTTAAAVTQLVNGLERAGYVTRERREGQRRSVAVTLTRLGLERHRAREQALAAALGDTLRHLGDDALTAATEVLRGLALVYDRL
ncbi:MarR family transcriptional regulator [Nocardia sp. NPDC049220]|uniref:MarR family winged helix-turn-helix transcriptional regulator n=1 Tax=Nocardia sp. NPDC049220 TaxID=3155273 RepID=UPI0033C0ED98